MFDEPPTPPADLPTDLVDTLDGYTPDQLRQVARYAEELAEHNAREVRLEEETDEDKDEDEDEVDERPDDLPSKATVTTEGINDNRDYDWQ